MIGKRISALFVAIALIVGSIVLRVLVFDDSSSPAAPEVERLACVTELADVCRSIARGSNGHVKLTIEPAGTTARRLVNAADGTTAGIDGWLTLSPWSEIVDGRRQRAGEAPIFTTTSKPLARSALVIAVRSDRGRVLAAHCGGTVTWKCIGTVAGAPWTRVGGADTWGTVKPAHPAPNDNASGLLVVGQAVGSFLSTPKLPVEQIGSNDWEASDTFPGWFQRLETSIPSDAFETGADPFGRWIQGRLANYSLVGGLESEIVPSVQRLQRTDRALGTQVAVVYPATVASADVVFASLGNDGRVQALASILARDNSAIAFTRAGWRVRGHRAAAGIDQGAHPLAAGNGLEAAGTLDALQALWQQVTQ
jgi:hypothetical protein